jgi:Mn2+/Fe2+ NRAMP family transporter
MTNHNDTRGRFFGMLAFIGPGIVVTGSVIGSGELVNTPVQAAKFGFILLWAVLLSCVIKYFLQVEIARHSLVHRRTTFQALAICPGPRIRGASWIGLVYMLGYVITMLPVVGILGALGGLMHGLFPLPTSPERSVQIWGALNALLALVLLWRGIYNHLETLVTILVAGFSVSVGIGLLLIQGTEFRITGAELLSGLSFSLGDQPSAAAFAVISLMGALGVAANELFMYPYWVLEKGYADKLGDASDPGWTTRARQWIDTIRLDAGLSTLVATVVTAAFFLLGCAVLFRQGLEPQGLQVVEQISGVYTTTYGEWSQWVFFCGAFCTLFSTLVVYTAASGRMWTDLAASLGLLDRDNPITTRRCHQAVQFVWLALLLAGFLLLEKQPAKLIIVGHFVLGAFMTPLLMFAICWMAFQTDRRVRMGRWWATALLASAGVILYCVLRGLYVQYFHAA